MMSQGCVRGKVPLPGECIALLVMQFVHYSAGYAAIDSLYGSQTITEEQALITLFSCKILFITILENK
jgi:hypothetical protein